MKTEQEQEFIVSIKDALIVGDIDAAIAHWHRLWRSGCRNPHVWVKAVDQFEPYNLADRIFPLFLLVALEIGTGSVWVLVALGRLACAAGVWATSIALCNEALSRGVGDTTKWHLLRCIYNSHVQLNQSDAAINTFVRTFFLLPLYSPTSIPISFAEISRYCSALGRHDLALDFTNGRLPAEFVGGAPDEAGGLTIQPNMNRFKKLCSIPVEEIHVTKPVSLNDIYPINRPAAPAYFVRCSRPKITFYELENIRVIGQQGSFVTMTESGEVLTSLSNFCPNSVTLSALSIMDRAFQQNGTYAVVDEVGIIRDPFPPPNICHFMLDQISRLYLFETSNIDIKSLNFIGPNLGASFQTEALALLGMSEKQFLPVKDIWAYRCRKLYVSDNVAATFRHPAHLGAPWALKFLRKKFTVDQLTDDKAIRLYVSRRNAAGRRVKNEAELVLLLDRFGFETILCENLSLEDQIRLFSRASHVVGPHGAGLTNIVFCPRTAKVLELFHPFYASDAFFYVAHGLDIDYQLACDSSVSLEARMPGNSYHFADIVAPLSEIEAWLTRSITTA